MALEAEAIPRNEFLEGAALSMPIILGVAPFGALFGMVAIQQGFTVAEAVFMSASVYGGASQLVGVDLFGSRVAPWLIVLSIFAVNFRHVLY
jgi:predicted branched-subunit amino acid permease